MSIFHVLRQFGALHHPYFTWRDWLWTFDWARVYGNAKVIFEKSTQAAQRIRTCSAERGKHHGTSIHAILVPQHETSKLTLVQILHSSHIIHSHCISAALVTRGGGGWRELAWVVGRDGFFFRYKLGVVSGTEPDQECIGDVSGSVSTFQRIRAYLNRIRTKRRYRREETYRTK